MDFIYAFIFTKYRLKIWFNALVANGNTLIVIEHNLEIIKCADWLIDLGPDGGNNGGQIMFEGTPEDMVKSKKSVTGKFLKDKISNWT